MKHSFIHRHHLYLASAMFFFYFFRIRFVSARSSFMSSRPCESQLKAISSLIANVIIIKINKGGRAPAVYKYNSFACLNLLCFINEKCVPRRRSRLNKASARPPYPSMCLYVSSTREHIYCSRINKEIILLLFEFERSNDCCVSFHVSNGTIATQKLNHSRTTGSTLPYLTLPTKHTSRSHINAILSLDPVAREPKPMSSVLYLISYLPDSFLHFICKRKRVGNYGLARVEPVCAFYYTLHTL